MTQSYRRLFLPFLLVIALSGLAEPSSADNLLRNPTGLDRILHEEKLSGITWSRVLNDRITSGAAGSSNLQAGVAMRGDHRIHIGSVTKTILATGVLRLVSEGRLDLDAPVEKVVPQIRFDNPWRKTHPVRVRHLLDHTAGLENLRVWQMFSKEVQPRDSLSSVFERDTGVLRVRTPPGETFSYSNIGYTMAGLVIEQVTGERYERWLDRNLLAPVGMKDSTFEFVSQVDNADPRLAWGHGNNLSLHRAMPVALRPAAQFTTTAHDMALFARFLMSDGSVDGRVLVQSNLLREMGQAQGTAAARAGLKSGYALGLTLRDRRGHLGRCHSGNVVGYRAMFCIYPEQRKAFFYSINTDGETADYSRFDDWLMGALNLVPQAAAPTGMPSPDIREWDGHYIPLVSGIALERYTDILMEGVSLDLRGKRPILDPDDDEAKPLNFSGGHLLRAEDRSIPSHALLRDEQGRFILTDGVRTYRAVNVAFVWALWTSLTAGLAGLVYVVLAVPILARRSGRSLFQPATIALLAIVPAGLLVAWYGFERFGDLTAGSALLFVATALLPLAVLVQAMRAATSRYTFWKNELTACLALLQWCVVLATFGLVPLALWK